MASAFLSTFQSQGLNSLVAGFSFAAAIAWLDVARWVIASLVKVPKTSGAYVLLSAVLVTILSIVVYMVLSRISSAVKTPAQPIYAVTM